MYRIILLLIFTVSLFPQQLETTIPAMNKGESFFIENKGQWPDEVDYLASVNGLHLWITDYGAVYDYYTFEKNFTETELSEVPYYEQNRYRSENTIVHGHVLRLNFIDAAEKPVDKPSGRSESYFNYYIGNDPAKWAKEVSAYEEVILQDVYEGIDIRYYYDEDGIRYDYQVDAGADISKIRFNLEGAESVSINENGELIAETSLGTVLHGKLFAYQDSWYGAKPVEVGFTMNESGILGLNAAEYDKGKDLIIDPLLYATYLGGSESEWIAEILRKGGGMVACGNTFSDNFPVTLGAYSGTKAGFDDFFISQFTSDGTGLQSSTFVGGSNTDNCYAAAKDGSGNIFVIGITSSGDFPFPPGGYDGTLSTIYDVVVFKYELNTNSLLASTYLGGNNYDYASDLSISLTDDIYLVGITLSNNFPIVNGAQATFAGSVDGFIAKFNNGLTSLTASSYLGGSSEDFAYGIALDAFDRPYVCGETQSADFFTIPLSYDVTYNGDNDIFVTAFNNNLTTIMFSTYLGGSSDETATDIIFDSSGNPVILGRSNSSNYPKLNAYKTSNQGYDIVLTKMNNFLTELMYSTYFGSSGSDNQGRLVEDSQGNIIFTGEIDSDDFPTTPGAFSKTIAGNNDVSITKLDISTNTLLYSTLYGGSDTENAEAIFLLNDSTVYCAGNSFSDDLPMTPFTYQPNMNGDISDGYIIKMEITEEGTLTLTSPSGGENWEAGTIQPITWESTKLDYVKLEYTYDGFNWHTIAAGTDATTGLYNWTIPNTPGTDCYVRITSVDFPHITDISGPLSFTIYDNALTVNDPNGGEIFRAGATETINWTAIGIDNVKIEYSLNNGSDWTVIDPSVTGSIGTYDWEVPNVSSTEALIRLSDELDQSISDVSNSVFTIADPTATISYDAGWNILSVPWTLDDPVASNVFTDIISDVFAYSSGYYVIYNLQAENGFWIKMSAAGSETVNGQGYSDNVINVFTGWNIIGALEYDVAVASIVESTSGLVESGYYEYSGGYSAASNLLTGKGYWVKCSQPGTLTLPAGPPKTEPFFTPEEDWITVTVSDAAGNCQNLYLADAEGNFELPPLPPNEIFDARFGNDTYLSDEATANQLRFQSEDYPLTISVTGGNLKLTDGATGTIINRQLLNGESMTITNKNIGNLNINTVEIPADYVLYQNYPNPFNPATTIKFGLPQAGKVDITVYNQLGQKVETLISKELEAGYHELEWNAMQYSSGVYFYTINSGNFKSVKKMLLLK